MLSNLSWLQRPVSLTWIWRNSLNSPMIYCQISSPKPHVHRLFGTFPSVIVRIWEILVCFQLSELAQVFRVSTWTIQKLVTLFLLKPRLWFVRAPRVLQINDHALEQVCEWLSMIAKT